MTPFYTGLLTGLFLVLLGALAWLLLRPGLRLRQVGRWLRAAMEDPEGTLHVPKGLRSVGVELLAVKERLARQREQARLDERRRQDLVAFLAHDLRTPLTSVLGYLQLLRDDPGLGEEQRGKYTDIALGKARRLEELVGEFFDITAMDLSLQKREPVQLSLLLEQLADEFYPLFAARKLRRRTEISPRLVVEGDGDKLARVFDNVLRNAVSYSVPGGPVDLTARQEGERAVVTVANLGLEIPEGELSNIFERFYRLDAARSAGTGGAGLGLAIAREIVDLHGGAIRAESDGERTVFTISLPLKK